MKIFNNIFAATYNYYSRRPNESPRFTSVCLVTLVISTGSLLFIIVLSKLIDYNILAVFPNKFYYYSIFGLLMFGIHKFYNSNRVERILSGYYKKTLFEKKCWGIVAIILVIAPIVIIAMILTK